MGKSTPTAPDPTATAQAQTASNEQTAAYQQQLNMINSLGPYGSVNYTPSGAPGGYTQTTSLSPAEQSIFDQGTAAQSGALGIANDQLGRVSSALGQSIDPSSYGSLSYGASGPAIQSSVYGSPSSYGAGNTSGSAYGAPSALPGSQVADYSAGNGNAPQSSFNPIQQAEDAAYGTAAQYLAPQFSQAQEGLQAQLAAQGLNPNDAAYSNAEQILGNQQNQAYQGAMNAAVTAGQNEQNTLYNQNLTSGEFTDQAQQQAYNESLQNATLENSAQQQAFQQGTYAQELPINELNSLLSSNQVTSPTGVSYTPSSVASTNVAQIDQNSFEDQLQDYNASNLMGGLFGLGSAALTKYSDRRLKTDIRRVGTLDSGLPIYAYRFKGSPTVEIGVMAQEAAVSHPSAVHADESGLLRVDYGALS